MIKSKNHYITNVPKPLRRVLSAVYSPGASNIYIGGGGYYGGYRYYRYPRYAYGYRYPRYGYRSRYRYRYPRYGNPRARSYVRRGVRRRW